MALPAFAPVELEAQKLETLLRVSVEPEQVGFIRRHFQSELRQTFRQRFVEALRVTFQLKRTDKAMH